jgi:hypothetical protein
MDLRRLNALKYLVHHQTGRNSHQQSNGERMKEFLEKVLEAGKEFAKSMVREVMGRPEIARVVEAVKRKDFVEAIAGGLDLLENVEKQFKELSEKVAEGFAEVTGIVLDDPSKIWTALTETAVWLKENIERVDPVKGLVFVSALTVGAAALYTGNAALAGRAFGFALSVATSIFNDLDGAPANYPSEVDNVRARPTEGFDSAEDYRSVIIDV